MDHCNYTEQTIDYINRFDFSYLITLTFRYDNISDYKAEMLFEKFRNKLHRRIFGIKSKKRLNIIAFLEECKSGEPHLHVLFQNPILPGIVYFESLKDVVSSSWVNTNSACGNPRVYCPKNSDWFKMINNDDKREVIGYCLKQIRYRNDLILWNQANLVC